MVSTETVRAAVMPQPEVPIEVREFPRPTLEPGAVLLKTMYSEVCGTDVHLHHGRLAGVPYPIIPGHVNVGWVAETAGEVADVDGIPLRLGDVVTFLDVHETCGRCWYCLVAKASTRCPHRRVYGITYSANEGLLGGWSQAIYLKPGVKALHLPFNIPPERFIAAGCGLPTAVHAIERAQIQLGDSVVIQGSGPVGLTALVLAQLQGAGQVIVVGAPALRLEVARALGADEVIDITQCDVAARVERVRALTSGRGADVTIEATGNPAAVREGMQMTRDAGRLVVVGQYTDAGDLTINPHWDINRKHLEVRGCWGSDFSHLYRGLRVLARYGDRFPWERMITRAYALDEANQALADVEHLRVVKALIQP
ncbi:MAG: zinc-binding dehydrogenase [Anaerolineae bacterium]|nr:zinc-binding dehydrogenase [Anaerolineae bacterium]MDW8097921.1 zinc-binding dehydrogenase [Anaerolineae bacterium]